MSIKIKSFNQILGAMIRTIIAETPLNDLNAGSVLLTLLEAAAANDFENNAAILNVLELLNIDAVKNNDLDDRAADYGLTRNAAIKASGLVNILNTNITKQSTGLYVIKPAPIAGQTTLFVNNTTGWTPTGTLYIGRGTQTFEGPIAYTSITNNVTYFTIALASALQRNHLISDVVVNSQGQPDQNIAAGTIVDIPANNQNPEIQYITLRDAVIPSGEVEVDGVAVIAIAPGSQGNAGIHTITSFDTAPFSGAAVTNTSAFSNGTDIETDDQLRNRIKAYATTLARGTAASILSAVIGVSDPDESKQVASAVISEPVKVGDPSILYIDDGTGFQPSFAGQSVDIMLTNATGKEKFLQLANYPVPRPQVINTQPGPFDLKSGSFLRVVVDGVQEDIIFTTSQFLNIAAATIAEIIVVINENSKLINARFVNNSQFILIYPIDNTAEILQVAPIATTDDPTLYINNLLKFPTDEFSYIALFRNATRLREKAKSASVETIAFALWNVTSTGDLVISVDDTPVQDQSFALTDFIGASSFASLTLANWVTVFNTKFAGLTATATASQTMLITSNKIGSTSAINVEGGTLLAKLFSSLPLTSVGQTSDFELNRQTGNLEIFTMNVGDTISAGVVDAKGFDLSAVTTSGTYNIGSDAAGRPSEMVVVADSTFCDQRSIPLLIGSTLDITNPSGSIMRIMSSTVSTWEALLPGDFIYLVKRTSGWLNTANTGLFKLIDKGHNITAGADSYIDVENAVVVPQASVSILDSLDIKAFGTDGFPQIWRGIYVTNPPAALITDIVKSLNTDLINVKASIYNSNSIKMTSTTEQGGSIAVPVAVSNASVLFAETKHAQLGNPPLIAHRVSARDLVSLFKRTTPTAVNVWLGRHTYSDLKGALSANAVPDPFPYAGTYSEIVTSAQLATANVSYEDYLSFTRGNNRRQFRNVKALISTNEVGTQEGTARTELDHIIGDEFQLIKPLQLSTDDSIVFIMDEDQTNNTVDIQMARTGQINSGSIGSFIPTTTEFSARDADNEPGITFSNTVVWGTTVQNTDFSDYAVWMKARNWYATGGVGSGLGEMIVRSAQFGPNGNSLRFGIAYPNSANQVGTTTYLNTPSFSQYIYFFGSGAARPTAISAGTTIAVKGPYPDASTNFPDGVTSSGGYFDYTFSAGNYTSVVVGDILSITTGSGVSPSNSGQFRVVAKSGNTFRLFNPAASNTTPGSPEVVTVTTVADTVGTPTSYQVTVGTSDANLATAATYGILAKTAITNSVGTSTVNGDLGESPGSTETGAITVTGATHLGDGAAATAQVDANNAYVTLAAHAGYVTIANDLGTVGTLSAGYYTFAAGDVHLADSGPQTLTLNGSATDVFVFKTPSTLTTGAGGMPTITLTGGALPQNVYWVVGSSATINVGVSSAGATFVGTILAAVAITVTQGGIVNGRLISTTASGTAITLSNVTTINVPGGGTPSALNLEYFTIYDTLGSVAIWYDVNNTGEPPPPTGANRLIKVAAVVTGDSPAVIATKTGQAVQLDNAFTVGVISNQITITNKINGALAAGTPNTSGFSIVTTTGTADVSVNGKYFIIYDAAGSVAVWYDVNNQGTPEPFDGANRSLRVGGVTSGMSATNVAAATVAVINADASFTASNIGAVITITNTFNGNVTNASAGTSGFSVSNVDGSLPGNELITNASSVAMFPLTGTAVSSIVTTINAGLIMTATAVGNPALTITIATSDETSATLAHGYSSGNSYVSMYDGEGWVKTFENPDPNFILKNTLVLQGAQPTIYSMDTAPNPDGTFGEYFKLIPTTIKNIYHQFTQPALSQLPIIANISITDDRKNVQVDSKKLGSAGAVEVVGGNANRSQAYILAESEVISDVNGSNLLVKIPAFPDTFNAGDFVMLQNDNGVKRLSRLSAADDINVTIPSANNADYNYDPKIINVTAATTFAITDVSASYGRAPGFVWRWTHDGSATLAAVNAGDQVFAFGPTIPWDQGNKPRESGDGNVAGLPIIFVNDASNYFDVVNPNGKAMSTIAVGAGNTVQICPTPIIRWNLAHAAAVAITSMSRAGSTVSVTTISPHNLNTGDSVTIADSNNVPDGTYSSIIVTSITQFTFILAGAVFSENNAGSSVINMLLTPTRYRVEKLGFNGMTRISRYDGASPMFIDSGVAVDDYLVISGNTFAANNNGIFRVTAVDNNSVMLVNSNASDQLNTVRDFNKQSLEPTWTANTNVVTGVAGTFKYLTVGDWVKKSADPDSSLLQVTAFSPSTPALATQITIGGNYPGSTAIAPGVFYDEANDYDKGIFLKDINDLAVYEGDAALAGDLLSVQNIINVAWFNVANIGNFTITSVGTDAVTYKPYVKVVNTAAIAQANVSMSVNTAGFYITESSANKYYSVRQISHIALDDINTNNRSVYMKPDDRSYKFSNANLTSLVHQGKLGYSTDVTQGIDGYLYYTGLLRRVQRIVDGFEPDQINYPGRRAVGGLIETLPPLVKRIHIAIKVTTGNGVNLGDISNNIKSIIIKYVQGLGVGQDVILSEITAQVMNITGVIAVTFTSPVPSTERITIGFNERADVIPEDIGIA